MLPTKHLRPFLAVVRLGTIAQAGEELRRVQSAISRSIQELEESFGVALFERGTRHWLLTDAGQILFRHAQAAFAELQSACDTLCSLYPASTPRLRSAPFFSLAVHERRFELMFAFAERRHINAAATLVGVSQPAASMALHDLEASVGVPLFDRAHSGVMLNETGQLLLGHVKRALNHLRLASTEIAARRGVIEGKVVVGALPFSRPYVLPAAVGTVLGQHPGLQVQTIEAPMEALISGLHLGDVDFLVGAMSAKPLEGGLIAEPLISPPMKILVCADHPLTRRRALRLTHILDARWVLPCHGTPTREALSTFLARRKLREPHVAVESSDLSVIRGLLLETDMISAASPQLFPYELRAGMLATLPVDLPGTERPIGILRRTQELSSPGAQLVMKEIRRLCADLHESAD